MVRLHDALLLHPSTARAASLLKIDKVSFACRLTKASTIRQGGSRTTEEGVRSGIRIFRC